jgi:hypothetical protein
MRSGNIVVHESTNDGIHAYRRVTITGGTLDIKSVGDAIQNERRGDNGYPITIGGNANLTLHTSGVKSHGIASDSSDVIIESGAQVKIRVDGNGSRGIRSRGHVEIKGGNIVIDTYGDVDITEPEDADDDGTTSAAGIRVRQNFIMQGGSLIIKSRGEDSKGINTNQNAIISGGNIDIISIDRSIKTGGNLTILGGSVTVKSTRKDAVSCGGCASDFNACNNPNVECKDRFEVGEKF